MQIKKASRYVSVMTRTYYTTFAALIITAGI